MFWFLILPLVSSGSVPQIQHIRVQPSNQTVRPNLVPNFSFEEEADGIPVGWRWSPRNTDAELLVDSVRAHTGRRSVRLTNSTSFGAHVYGTLWTEPAIPVKPNTRYTLSFYALSDSPGAAWVGGGKGWNIRVSIEPTQGQWRRFHTEFTTDEDETEFVLRINTDSPTPGFRVDDLKLEEGTPASFCEPPPSHVELVLSADESSSVMVDEDWKKAFDVYTHTRRRVELQVELTQGDASSQRRMEATLEQGFSHVQVSGEARDPSDRPCTLVLRIHDPSGLPLADASTSMRFLSPANARTRLTQLRERSRQLDAEIEQVKQAGQDPAYPLVKTTILRNFIGYVEADLEHGEIQRAFDQINELERLAQEADEQLRSAREGQSTLPEVPRYVTSPITIDGPSLVADAFYPVSRRRERRPIFFTGYGHFAQVRRDLERFPGYGVNIIQIEFGPHSIFPEEGVASDATIREFLKDFDRAADAGVSVCLLISPHYMPDWMLEKHPDLQVERVGFLKYCLHAPAGQEFLKRYLQFVIPRIKDHPALHSICLTNEPVNAESSECKYAQQLWHEWLKTRHGEVTLLNQRWRTEYASFKDVPLPEPRVEPTPLAYEFVRFNQEWFAGWHRMLADTIHEIAPNLPVHAKAMAWNFFSDGDQRFGVNAELFASFSQINGNDSVNSYTHGRGEWSQSWQLNNAGHDLQRSVADLPVFNSENHLIRDRETRFIPPGHVRTTLWQAAIHGQSATTIWVWERTYDPKSDFAGSIMHRPACAEAVGRTGLDLMRLAKEVQAIQQLPAQVGLLYSTTAMVYDGGAYTDCLNQLVTVLSFTGLKVGFVTERQLASGTGHRPPLLLVPNIGHLSDTAFDALRDYPGRVVLVGSGLLSRDEYGHERTAVLDAESVPFSRGETEARGIWEDLLVRLPAWGIEPLVRITDSAGQPVWGVEWLTAKYAGGIVVNLIQHARQAVEIQVLRDKTPVRCTDLFTGKTSDGTLLLKPLSPRLLRQDQ